MPTGHTKSSEARPENTTKMSGGLITSEGWWRAHYNYIKDHGYQLRLPNHRIHDVGPLQSRAGRRVSSEEDEWPCLVSPIHLVALTLMGHTTLM